MSTILLRIVWASMFFLGLLLFYAGIEAELAGQDEVWMHFKNVPLLIWALWTATIIFPDSRKRGPRG